MMAWKVTVFVALQRESKSRDDMELEGTTVAARVYLLRSFE